MIIGETLFRGDNETSSVYYSPFAPSQGNGLAAICDVIESHGGVTCQIDVETKKAEDDDAAAVSVTASFGAPGAQVITLGARNQTIILAGQNIDNPPVQWALNTNVPQPINPPPQGLMELFRFKYELAGGSPLDFVHFRMMVGSWFTH